MSEIRKVDDPSESAALEAKILRCFNQADLEGEAIFVESVNACLLFDYQHITEPYRFINFIRKEDKGVYVGHLGANLRNQPVDGAVFIPGDANEAAVSLAFNEQISARDGPLQVFVKNGFVVHADFEWGIWFSTNWEIAIAGFRSPEAGSDFVIRHREIMFLNNDMVIEKYARNPASMAPFILEYYLERNIVGATNGG